MSEFKFERVKCFYGMTKKVLLISFDKNARPTFHYCIVSPRTIEVLSKGNFSSKKGGRG